MTQNAINNSASSMDIANINIAGNTISSTDTDGDVIIAPDGAGTVSVTAAPVVPSTDRADSLGSATNSWDNVFADGLTFDDGTNVMANYEEGTFLPDLLFGGLSTGPITYLTQDGLYTRIGRVVFLSININLSSKGTAVGNATIADLPFTAGATNEVGAIGRFANFTLNAGSQVLNATIQNGDTTMVLRSAGSGGSSPFLDDTNFQNSSNFFFQIMMTL